MTTAATFIGMTLMRASPSINMKEAAAILDSTTVLSRDAIQQFLYTWFEDDDDESGGPKLDLDRIRQGGTLYDLKWRIGAIIDSNAEDHSTIPYVDISFNVRNLDGYVNAHHFQLGYRDFYEFLSQIRSAAIAMDSV
jgi:hypothetical protein